MIRRFRRLPTERHIVSLNAKSREQRFRFKNIVTHHKVVDLFYANILLRDLRFPETNTKKCLLY